jgi:hypothetical protein
VAAQAEEALTDMLRWMALAEEAENEPPSSAQLAD